jgi:SnoaL-like domain
MGVDTLSVHVEITRLLDEFFSHVDRAEPVAELLTDDVEFRGATGRDAVTELLLSLAEKRRQTGRTSRHFTSNVTIDELGDGKYRVRSLALIISQITQPEETGELTAAEHDDVVALDEDGRFRYVKLTMAPVLKLGLNAL